MAAPTYSPVGLTQAEGGQIGPNRDMVRMKLLSETSQRIKYQQRWYIIEPNREALVPWGLMVCIAGNPYATDTGNRRDRTEELRRLRNLWGIYHDSVAWENRPVIQFTDMEDNVLPTPLWDPEESTGSVMEAVGTTADNKFLMTEIDKLRAQISQMGDLLKQREAAESARATSQLADSNDPPDPPEAPIDGTVKVENMRTSGTVVHHDVPDPLADQLEPAVTEDTGRPKRGTRPAQPTNTK